MYGKKSYSMGKPKISDAKMSKDKKGGMKGDKITDYKTTARRPK